MTNPIPGNPSLSEALKIAEDVGCTIAYRERTGEIRVTHPSRPKGVMLNSRRKDTAVAFVSMLRQIKRERERESSVIRTTHDH